uniref:Glutathione synthetase n=1 Tax=Globodera rostochiensis TaxID=31243 RepID=A0A914H5E9_GLORO
MVIERMESRSVVKAASAPNQKHRSPFTSSFYTLFIALGFVDLSKFVLYIVKKCSYWGCVSAIFYPLNHANRAANLIYFFLWALSLVQFQLNFLMSLNRFCAICCSQLYRCRWTPKITQYLLISVFTVSFVTTAPILWQPVCFRSSEMRGIGTLTKMTTGPVFMNISALVVYYNITKVFAISHLAFLLIAYPMMCRKIRHINIKQRSQAVEIRMFYALILLSIANFLFAVYLITWDILSRRHNELAPIAEWTLYIIVDFYDMNSPYGLLITSKVVRKYSLPFCLLWRNRLHYCQSTTRHHAFRQQKAREFLVESAPKQPTGSDNEKLEGISAKENVLEAKNEAESKNENEEINIQAIVDDAIDYAHKISLITLPTNHRERSDLAVITPFSLFPTPFPRDLFELAQKVQKAYNLLYFRISNDFDFLVETFEPVAVTNESVRTMLNILKSVHAEGIKQTKSMVLARSDYMCNVVTNKETNEQHYELKQVEMNAGQIGGLSVSSRITEMHRRTLQKAGLIATNEHVPDNEPDLGTAEMLYAAWQAFNNPKAIILFVASRTTTNRFGQRHIEYEIERISNRAVKVVRIALPQCNEMIEAERLILADDYSLRLDGHTVAVVYLATYSNKVNNWAARHLFERSTAILSPTIALDLASLKKVQQLLAKPGMIERFLPEDPSTVAMLRSTFAGLWSLNDKDERSQKAIKDAIEHPENYVIKPNMEGGGHNFFDQQVREKLLSFTDDEREAHILMQKLQPMVIKNYMVRSLKEPVFGEMTTELGIFGFLVGDSRDKTVAHNVQKGHFLRTKLASVNEGGVSLGTGVFDSPYLIP